MRQPGRRPGNFIALRTHTVVRSTHMNSCEVESQPVTVAVDTVASLPMAWNTVAAVLAAGVASTSHRIRCGEGALLAVNLSLIVQQGLSFPRSLAQAIVSVLALGSMYAFNDLYDAPTDSNNP